MPIEMIWMSRGAPGLAALLWASSAFTQSTPPATAAAASYCVAAAGSFLTSDPAGIEAALRCAKGDIIAIPASKTRIIARLCDFDKSLAVADGSVICALNGGDRGEKR
jgi:hypothetical protein